MGLKTQMTGSGAIGEIKPGWSIAEDATPVNPVDSSAGTGIVTISATATPTSKFIIDNQITVSEPSLGSFVGIVKSSTVQGASVDFNVSTLVGLLVTTKTAPQQSALNLSQIIRSYVALCTTQITVSYQATNDPIRTYSAWEGEVWYYLKQLAAINKIQFSFSGTTLIVSDLGSSTYVLDDQTPVMFSTDSTSTGRSINIVCQNTQLASPLIIRNNSQNPSLETNATDWSNLVTNGAATVARI